MSHPIFVELGKMHQDKNKEGWGIERNIGRRSVEQAELWAIYDGLQFAWDVKWNEVIMRLIAL
ncbi:hypothetical protein PVK06_019794 [Gossypium arboreum]|uniref:RNase H type-1 domain-containing protein n=1 Tax=Gossypium arboreum TaxID=29729 RepID=A0ABR0PKM8_GOSAR|nr:hypothetical protein PVK06_019794 [Gossypium arboreum]